MKCNFVVVSQIHKFNIIIGGALLQITLLAIVFALSLSRILSLNYLSSLKTKSIYIYLRITRRLSHPFASLVSAYIHILFLYSIFYQNHLSLHLGTVLSLSYSLWLSLCFSVFRPLLRLHFTLFILQNKKTTHTHTTHPQRRPLQRGWGCFTRIVADRTVHLHR